MSNPAVDRRFLHHTVGHDELLPWNWTPLDHPHA